MRRFTKGRLLATTCAFALGFSVPSDPAWYDPQEHDGISYDASIDSDNGGHVVVKVPGQQPQHGSLTDFFTVTRNSVGTFRGPGGYVKYANENLVLQSQTLDNVAWTYTSASAGANVALAPDGSLTAESIIEAAATSGHFAAQLISKPASSLTYTYTIHMKANTRNFGHIRIANGIGTADARVAFDLVNGIVGTPGTTGAGMVANSAAMTPVGNGWWRCSLVCTTDTDTGIQPVFGTAIDLTNVFSYLGNGTSSIFVWGAQVQRGPFYGKYLATVAAQKFDQPRVEWDQSINYNLALNSEDFTATASLHSQLGIVTPVATDVAIAPNGTLTADKIVADTSTGGHRIRQATDIAIPVGSPVSYSVHVKAAGRTKAMILVTESTFASTAEYVFDLVSGSIGLIGVAGTASGASAFMTDVGNGWWRIGVTVTIGGAFSSVRALTEMCSTDGTANAFTGDGVSGLLVWGEQLTLTSTHLPYIKTGAVPSYGSYNEKCRGYLAESQGTNLVLQSQDLATTWIVAGASISSNVVGAYAPDNTLTTDKLVEGAAGTFHLVRQDVTITANTSYIFSAFLAPAGRGFCRVQFSDTLESNGAFVDVNLYTGATGTVTTFGAGSAATAIVTPWANGFFRVQLRCTIDAVATTARAQVLTASALGTVNYSGDGASGIYCWGGQVELATFNGQASSYMPTFTTTTTRIVDGNQRSVGAEFTTAKGTVLTRAIMNQGLTSGAGEFFWNFDKDGITTDRIGLVKTAGGNNVNFRCMVASVFTTINDYAGVLGETFKHAVSWDGTNTFTTKNAGAVNTVAQGAMPTIAFLSLNMVNNTGFLSNSNLLGFDYFYNEARPPAMLQDMTR